MATESLEKALVQGTLRRIFLMLDAHSAVRIPAAARIELAGQFPDGVDLEDGCQVVVRKRPEQWPPLTAA